MRGPRDPQNGSTNPRVGINPTLHRRLRFESKRRHISMTKLVQRCIELALPFYENKDVDL